eukprot:10594874-Ditylum_brightwellii.AAC.1
MKESPTTPNPPSSEAAAAEETKKEPKEDSGLTSTASGDVSVATDVTPSPSLPTSSVPAEVKQTSTTVESTKKEKQLSLIHISEPTRP